MEDFDLAMEYEAGDRRDWESLQRRKAEAEKVRTEAVPYIQQIRIHTYGIHWFRIRDSDTYLRYSLNPNPDPEPDPDPGL